LFHRNNDCGCGDSSSGCNSCGGGYGPGTVTIMPKAETIPPPNTDPAKKMPDGPAKQQVQTINPTSPMPAPAPNLELAPAAPAIVPAPPGQDRPF
jgi:hypothetical protein